MSEIKGRKGEEPHRPVMPWNSQYASDKDDKVVWWTRLDKKYQIEVHRTGTNTGLLIIFEPGAEEQVLYSKEVRLLACAVFGPDEQDVQKWKKLVTEFVDERNGFMDLRRSIGEDTIEMARFLIENLGERITAVGVGINNAQILRDWRDGSSQPSTEQQERLSILFEVAKNIISEYDSKIARAYLRGTHRDLPESNILIHLANATDFTAARAEIIAEVNAFLFNDL